MMADLRYRHALQAEGGGCVTGWKGLVLIGHPEPAVENDEAPDYLTAD